MTVYVMLFLRPFLPVYFITQDFLVTLLLEGYLQMSSLQNCKALAWITEVIIVYMVLIPLARL